MRRRMDDKLCEVENAGRAAALSYKPMYSCGRCGATSHDANNVCDPKELPSG